MDLRKELADLTNPAPVKGVLVEEDDAENYAQLRDVEVEEDELSTEHEARVSRSLRKLNEPVLGDIDERYRGKKVTRKDLYSDDSGGEMDEEFSEGQEEEDAESDEEEDEGDESGEDSPDVVEMEGSDQEDEEEGGDEEEEEYEGEANIIDAGKGRESEVEKGKAVQQQFQLWDQLMGARIRMQKLLQFVNQMPQTDQDWARYLDKKKDLDGQKACLKGLEHLLDSLTKLQTQLYSKTPSLNRMGKESKDYGDDEITSSSSDDEKAEKEVEPYSAKRKGRKRKMSLEESESLAAKRHDSYKSFRDDVLLKWFERTKMASGRFSSKSHFSSFDTNVIKQINQILVNKTRLISRTQVKRSDYKIFGSNEPIEDESTATEPRRNPEIVDDQDFYQTLLRELIQRKGGNSKDPATASRQWIEMERLRQTRKKKAVDTKASKGRKIRYDVKPKLVNFMAPVESHGVWRSEEAKDELFSSVFGQRPITKEP